MKTKLDRAVKAAQIVARLNAIRTKMPSTARKIFGLKKLLQENFEFYAAEESKLIDALGGNVAEDGTIIFHDQKEGMRQLTEGRRDLLETEVEISIDKPVIFRDSEGLQVSGEEIEILDGLADFKEG